MLLLLILQAALFLYYQVITLLNLYPFNNVRHFTMTERLTECTVNGALMALPLVGFAFNITWIQYAAMLIYPALLLGEYLSWWHPYFFGASANYVHNYNRVFRSTVIVLPSIRNNPVPNLEHCILHLLTLIAAVCTYIYFFSA